MKPLFVIFTTLILCCSCLKNKDEVLSSSNVSNTEELKLEKMDDESCDTQEDLKEKLEAQIETAKENPSAISLQGETDQGCEI